MKYQTSLLRWAGLLSLVFAVFVFAGLEARGAVAAKPATGEKRADVVIIDAMAADGKRELPAVIFQHDQHTKALEAMQKDCSSCHSPLKQGEAALSFRFMDSEGKQGEALKNVFHKNCIGCHADLLKSGRKTGPQEAECRSCHVARPSVVSNWQDMAFDKVIHYKHVASPQITVEGNDKNCAACHHVYDAAAQKLVWGKDKEDSCRACHVLPAEQKALLAQNPEAADDNGLLAKRPTLDVAAHQSCINCHLTVAAKKLPDAATGPVDCAGCHSPEAQAVLAERSAASSPTAIPRLERGQPDVTLMLPAPSKGVELKGMMRPVSFNHKFHESVTMDCRTCHHTKIDACSSCHSLEGKAEGGFVPQAMSMHKADSTRSCLGCHNQQKAKPECAGCHVTPAVPLGQNSCAACHSTPPGMSDEAAENASLLTVSKEEAARLAKAAVAARESMRVTTFGQDAIPEMVRMDILAKEFAPSDLPHRKIVNTLVDKQKNSRLAAVFHAEEATLCQGCHHNTPPSKTPPRCVSCHGVNVPAVQGWLPLKAAYHQQCMTCHARMNQKPAETQCADCHKPRGN